LQTTPGLIIDRYHGGGKADQILFRGFDSDNGTIKVNAQAPILEKHLTILAYNYHFGALLGITGAVVCVIGSFDFISASLMRLRAVAPKAGSPPGHCDPNTHSL